MISFFIDTSSSYPTVAIYRDCLELGSFHNLVEDDLSTKIFSIIDDVFTKSGVVPKEIDIIFVVNGPGSFTGVRIGVTIAKVLAYSLNKKIISISSLELMASGFNEGYIMPLIDARRGYVYGSLYDFNLDTVVPDSYIMLNNLLELKRDNAVICTYDSFSFEVSMPKINISKIISKHNNDEGVNPHLLNPNYLKRTEAEEKRAL